MSEDLPSDKGSSSASTESGWRARIQTRIVQLGWSRAEFNRAAGLGGTTAHDILDRGVVPSVDRFAAIAGALGMGLDELYFGTRSAPPASGSTHGITHDIARLEAAIAELRADVAELRAANGRS